MQGRHRWLRRAGWAASSLLAGALLLEALLQAASFAARDRATAWRAGSTVRVLCIGDSHTYGGGVEPAQAYPAQLQQQLDERAPGRYSVINLGIPGMNTSQVRERLPLQVARLEPDLVIAWAGVNNDWNAASSGANRGLRERLEALALRSRLYRLVRVRLHDRALERIASEARAGGEPQAATPKRCEGEACGDLQTTWTIRGDDAVDVIENRRRQTPPDDARFEASVYADYRAMHAWLETAGIPLVLLRYPLDLWPTGIANRAIARLAREEGIPVVDTQVSVARLPPGESGYLWANHPNAAMYREIARDLVPVVEVLESGRGPQPAAADGR